jgi:hypothetical protein
MKAKKPSLRKKEPEKGGILQRFEQECVNAANASKIALFRLWVEAYFHPVETIEREKRNATFFEMEANVFFSSLVYAIAYALYAIAILQTLGFMMPSANRPGLLDVLGAAVEGPVIALFTVPIAMGLLYLTARLLGGRGKYLEQSYGYVLVEGGIHLICAPLTVLSAMPCLGFVFSLAFLAVFAYGIYSQYRVVRHVHALSRNRAIATMVIFFAITAMATLLYVLYAMGWLR